MANGWTNRGRKFFLDAIFLDATIPTNFYVMLLTSADTPSATTNLVSDVTEIAAGNGYTTGGFSLSRNATDFPTLTEDDTNNEAVIVIKDVSWTASGGSIPSSGDGARWAVLTDDNGTIADREIYVWWDLTSDRTSTVGQTLSLSGLDLAIQEPA